jgi:hypothetical protein
LKPATRNAKPETRKAEPEARNPQSQPRNRKRSTGFPVFNPKPETALQDFAVTSPQSPVPGDARQHASRTATDLGGNTLRGLKDFQQKTAQAKAGIRP